MAVATFFDEAQTSLGKHGVEEGTQSVYTMGFLSMLWGFVFYLIIIISKQEFLFSLASLPTLGARIVLELILAHISVLAIIHADRSTYSFIRFGTIPLLLITDLLLGYTISTRALIGIGIILMVLILLFMRHEVRKAGMWYVLGTTLLAVATLSLFKYNITHFNSVQAEESIVVGVLLIFFFTKAMFIAKENPLRLLGKPAILGQSLSAGLGNVLMSFAFLYGAASIITTAKRGLGVFWAILSGNIYFKETGMIVKFLALITLIFGLVLTAF